MITITEMILTSITVFIAGFTLGMMAISVRVRKGTDNVN